MRFFIKFAFWFMAGLFSAQNLHACCMAEYVAIYPREGAITRNPVFLLEFEAAEFKLENKLDELEFYLETIKKRKIKVDVLRKVSGTGPSTQLLLKANDLLKVNDSVRLQVRFKKGKAALSDEQFKVYQEQVNRKQWYITIADDQEPVAWASEITWQKPDFRANSVDMFEVKFTYQLTDSNPVYYEFLPGKIFPEQLFEVEVDGKVFYAIGGGPKINFSIYRSDCGGNFYVHSNKNYEAKITALDFSGNRSIETRQVAFNTFRP